MEICALDFNQNEKQIKALMKIMIQSYRSSFYCFQIVIICFINHVTYITNNPLNSYKYTFFDVKKFTFRIKTKTTKCRNEKVTILMLNGNFPQKITFTIGKKNQLML